MPTPPGQAVIRLVTTLVDVEPAVWRRLLVPGSVRLDKLHRILQAAMGWDDHHLHCFEIDGQRFGIQFDEYPEGELDEKSVTVHGALSDVDRFTYEYDFGDGWEHDVVIEARWRMPTGLKYGVCLDGANACPPEDCGGAPGYEYFLQAIADPSHDDHDDMVGWVGGDFDAAAFDIAAANARLQTVRWTDQVADSRSRISRSRVVSVSSFPMKSRSRRARSISSSRATRRAPGSSLDVRADASMI